VPEFNGPLTGEAVASPPTGEIAALVRVQSMLSGPTVVRVARGLSHFGEHAAGWVGLSAVGAVAAPGRRREWLVVGVASVAAHAASIVIKQAVRRKRPHHRDVEVKVDTPSSLSFPSAHATSTTAAALLLCRATRSPYPLALVPLMAVSRLVLGVHYPSDVLSGIIVGAAVAQTSAKLAGPGKGSPAPVREGHVSEHE